MNALIRCDRSIKYRSSLSTKTNLLCDCGIIVTPYLCVYAYICESKCLSLCLSVGFNSRSAQAITRNFIGHVILVILVILGTLLVMMHIARFFFCQNRKELEKFWQKKT